MTNVEKVISQFREFKPDRPKNRQPTGIALDGKLVAMKNGKKVWPGVGAAKNALRNHITHCHYYYADEQKIYDTLMATGRITFVPLEG